MPREARDRDRLRRHVRRPKPGRSSAIDAIPARRDGREVLEPVLPAAAEAVDEHDRTGAVARCRRSSPRRRGCSAGGCARASRPRASPARPACRSRRPRGARRAGGRASTGTATRCAWVHCGTAAARWSSACGNGTGEPATRSIRESWIAPAALSGRRPATARRRSGRRASRRGGTAPRRARLRGRRCRRPMPRCRCRTGRARGRCRSSRRRRGCRRDSHWAIACRAAGIGDVGRAAGPAQLAHARAQATLMGAQARGGPGREAMAADGGAAAGEVRAAAREAQDVADGVAVARAARRRRWWRDRRPATGCEIRAVGGAGVDARSAGRRPRARPRRGGSARGHRRAPAEAVVFACWIRPFLGVHACAGARRRPSVRRLDRGSVGPETRRARVVRGPSASRRRAQEPGFRVRNPFGCREFRQCALRHTGGRGSERAVADPAGAARVASAPMNVTLPDGTLLDLPDGASGADAAAAIGPGLARAALAVKVDGEVRDLARPLDRRGGARDHHREERAGRARPDPARRGARRSRPP